MNLKQRMDLEKKEFDRLENSYSIKRLKKEEDDESQQLTTQKQEDEQLPSSTRPVAQ